MCRWCISSGPRPRGGPGACFLPLDTGVHASENPGGLGAGPQGSAHAAAGRSSFAWLLLLVLHRLPEAKAFAIHLEDVAAVRQAVEQRCRHAFPLEHLAPLAERQVARQQQAPPLVAFREHLEQQFRPRLAERQVAQFVNYV